MDCPEENVFVDFVRGELPKDERVALESHIDECDACSMVVAEMARLFADDPPPGDGDAPLPEPDLVEDAALQDTDGAFSPTAVTQGPDGEILKEPSAMLPQGAKLGRYVVIDRVGAGGMGVVYAAYDPELDRKVALKVLRRGALGTGMSSGPRNKQRDRLMREAQAMAKLSHPNVITVHDVGTFEGQVFLAMEFIDGQTLGEWFKQANRTWKEVLAIFIAAGQGLAAAHAVGLVHRDFKPDNVLIGNDGRVLVTDFGLARPAAGKTGSFSAVGEIPSQQVLTASLTQTGALVGTPAYMAPEQLSGTRTSPLTDQFSFCVALYEGLFGERPFRGRSFAELASNVVSGSFAPPPRDVSVPRWVRRVLFRGLATDPEQRFPEMDQLISALRHDPYRPWRRWGAVVLPAGLFLVGTIAYERTQSSETSYCDSVDDQLQGIWDDGKRKQMRESFLAVDRPFAKDALEITNRNLDDYASHWVEMQGTACRDQVRGEQPQAVLALRMHCLDQRRENLRAVTDLLAEADAATVEGAVDAARGLPRLELCEDLDALTTSVPAPPDDPKIRERVAAIERKIAVGRAKREGGKYRETITIMREALAEAQEVEYRPAEAEALSVLATALERAGEMKEAETTYHRALSSALAAGHARVMGEASVGLVWLTGLPDRPLDEAERWATHGLAALEPLGHIPELQAQLNHSLMVARINHGEFDAAEEALQRVIEIREAAFGKGHHSLGAAMSSRGQLMAMRGRFEEAIDAFERARKHTEHEYGPHHPNTATVVDNLAIALSQSGKLEQARSLQERALQIREASFGPDHFEVATSHLNIAATLNHLGKHEASKAHALETLRVYTEVFGERDLELTAPLTNLGSSEVPLGQWDEAEEHMRRAALIAREHLGDDHPRVARYRFNLGQLLGQLNRPDEALIELRASLSIRETAMGPEHAKVGESASAIAEVLVSGKDEADEAVALAERALRIAALHEVDAEQRGSARWALAQALWHSNEHRDRPRARAMAELARTDFASMEDEKKTVAMLATWLEEHPLER